MHGHFFDFSGEHTQAAPPKSTPMDDILVLERKKSQSQIISAIIIIITII